MPTRDGLAWVTAATDSRVRLWDAGTYRNMLVNYRDTFNHSLKVRRGLLNCALQIACGVWPRPA
jgi:hypothetical protein